MKKKKQIKEKEVKKRRIFREMFSDEHGTISSKRILGSFCVVALISIIYLTMLLPGEIQQPSDSVIDAVAMLAFSLMGLASVDKIGKMFGRNKD